MNLTIPAETLKRSFATCFPFVPRRTTRDSLKYIRLANRAGRMEMIASDGDSSIIHQITGLEQALPTRSFMLPADRFGQVLHESKAEEYSLSGSQGELVIHESSNEFRLCTIDEQDYPDATIPTGEPTASITVAAKALRTALDLTGFATDVESTRYAMGGVKFEAVGDKLHLIATDSRRLSFVEVAGSGGDKFECIIPALDIKRLITAAGNLADAADVVIGKHPSKMTFALGQSLICCSEIQGRFPAWRNVVPKDQPHCVFITAGPLMSAVRAARLAREDIATSAAVDITFAADEMVLSAGPKNKLGGQTRLPISGYAGPKLTMALDPDYLVQWLGKLDPSVLVEWKVGGSDSAQLLVAGDAGYVVMVMERE